MPHTLALLLPCLLQCYRYTCTKTNPINMNVPDSIDDAREELHRLIRSFSDAVGGWDGNDDVDGVIERVMTIIDRYPALCRRQCCEGGRLLHYAVMYDSPLRILEHIIEVFPNSIKMLDDDKRTPLHLFLNTPCQEDDLPFINTLVGTNPSEILKMKDSIGNTPLHKACKRKQGIVGLTSATVLQRLVELCPEVLELDEDTPLHAACKRSIFPLSQVDRLRVLAISEAAVKAKDRHGRNPFHLLCHVGASEEDLTFMLQRCKSLITERDSIGRTPLHIAIEAAANESLRAREMQQFDKAVSCLLNAFPDAVRVRDNNGMTPLQVACQRHTRLDIIYQLVCFNPIAMLGLESVRTKKRNRDSNTGNTSCDTIVQRDDEGRRKRTK